MSSRTRLEAHFLLFGNSNPQKSKKNKECRASVGAKLAQETSWAPQHFYSGKAQIPDSFKYDSLS